jgi:hypothetical protein
MHGGRSLSSSPEMHGGLHYLVPTMAFSQASTGRTLAVSKVRATSGFANCSTSASCYDCNLTMASITVLII